MVFTLFYIRPVLLFATHSIKSRRRRRSRSRRGVSPSFGIILRQTRTRTRTIWTMWCTYENTFLPLAHPLLGYFVYKWCVPHSDGYGSWNRLAGGWWLSRRKREWLENFHCRSESCGEQAGSQGDGWALDRKKDTEMANKWCLDATFYTQTRDSVIVMWEIHHKEWPSDDGKRTIYPSISLSNRTPHSLKVLPLACLSSWALSFQCCLSLFSPFPPPLDDKKNDDAQ